MRTLGYIMNSLVISLVLTTFAYARTSPQIQSIQAMQVCAAQNALIVQLQAEIVELESELLTCNNEIVTLQQELVDALIAKDAAELALLDEQAAHIVTNSQLSLCLDNNGAIAMNNATLQTQVVMLTHINSALEESILSLHSNSEALGVSLEALSAKMLAAKKAATKAKKSPTFLNLKKAAKKAKQAYKSLQVVKTQQLGN